MSEIIPTSYDDQPVPNPQILEQVGPDLNQENLHVRGIRLVPHELQGQGGQPLNLATAEPLQVYDDGRVLIAIIDAGDRAVEVVKAPNEEAPGEYHDMLLLYRASGIKNNIWPVMVHQGQTAAFGAEQPSGRRLGLEDNSKVSRTHFAITGLGDRYVIADLNSTNGTRLITGVKDPNFYGNQTVRILP